MQNIKVRLFNLMSKSQKKTYAKDHTKDICNNKKIWKTVWPYFIGNNSPKITLIENNSILRDKERIADLKLTCHSILHYSWSADLLKSFS